MTRRTAPQVYVLLGIQTCIGAGTYLAAKQGMRELPPLTLLYARFILGGLVFGALLVALRSFPPHAALRRVLALGLLAGPLNQGMLFYGLSRSLPSHAAFLYALTPALVYLYGVWRGHERASRWAIGGIAIAFVGVLVLLLGKGLAAAAGPLVGDLFIFGAVCAWTVYTAEGKLFIEAHGWLQATAWTMTAASALALPLAPWLFEGHRLAHASAATWVAISYLVALTSVAAYFLWYFALSRLAASKVAVFSNLQPVLTALAARALFGDALTWEVWVGGALVLFGVRIAQRR